MKAMPGRIIDVLRIAEVTSLAVASEAVVRSHCFSLLEGAPSLGVEFQLDGLAPKVKIEIECANQELAGAEGSADDNFAVPDSDGTVTEECSDENVHFVPISPCFAGLYRYKITGLSGNGADTVVTRLRARATK